ncbi:tetratricopeptide repeat protein [Bradyrhizobium canariense]|uniref:TPR repeat-containing protein n=1 Tax=Bradyrhizobium canariense TaxID=255045 RepID=A0A1H2BR52_9BRAD|nr:tetratricopeptide repeat protein [Bradyrhizobium canariense]SDT60594.1 TPR repeat-containing protein [Bradyrhizobium canariense]
MTAPAPAARAADTEQASPAGANWLRIGDEHYSAGRNDDAIAAYQCGLAAIAAAPAGSVPVETISELHSRLGNACMVRGDVEAAAVNYRAALRLVPELTSCWCNLGNIHVQTGRPQEAIAFYLQALKLNPAHWASRTNLVQALMATKQFVIAKALLQELAGERPQDSAIQHQLGKACFELDEVPSAIECFERALALNPRDADSLYWIGGIRQNLGEIEAAQKAYAQAAQIQPLIRRPAIKSPADFRVLALYAPFGGNTPTEYLFKHANYETDTLALFEQNSYDAEVFKQGVHVVVNLISDVDQAVAMLPLAADLAARLGKPIINDPRKIQRTTRDEVAERLAGIPDCRIPKILRQQAGTELSVEQLQAAFPLASSILARPVGTHGGDDFEKLDHVAELAAYLAQPAETDRYFIEYADYRSPDGYFRKYRFIFVDDQVLPYHLAIGNDWKVHHVNTDMANQKWMQNEEAAFLNDPGLVFNAAHFQALRAIQQRIGLEYFGIDCGLDTSGDLLVFEVNASMLVHDDNKQFPYKDPAVRRIKSAFDAMLAKFAGIGAA